MNLGQIAPSLEIDAAQLSKIEKGLCQLKKGQIPILAKILKTDKEGLLMLCLAVQGYIVFEDGPMADEALKSVSKKLKNEKRT